MEPLEILRRRWADNIKMVLKAMEYDFVEWIHLV